MTSTKYAPIAALMHTDAYKLGHVKQYRLAGEPTVVYSNYTNRGSRIPGIEKVAHFGLQAFIQQLADDFEVFFRSDEDLVCLLYQERLEKILGPNNPGNKHIRDLHCLGYLPLRFCALPEGTLVPLRVPSFTVENTLPEFFWLTNYIETAISSAVWQPSTAATIAHEYRRILTEAAEKTGADTGFVEYQCHDFSYRGMSSSASAAVTGAAHLLSFTGSDSLNSLEWIDRYYGGEYTAGSVPATEHSVMCAGIEAMGELETYSRLLDLYPTGIVSIVSDTFDLWRVLTEYLPELSDKIMARDGKLVIRPDSGDPEKIICGDPDAEYGSPAFYGVVQLLHKKFGAKANAKGFYELDSHVGVMYGDSITRERAQSITARLEEMGYASTNVIFGVGSYTYQYVTRDTFGSAMKATWVEIDGEGRNLLKDPVTDNGLKRSATGRLAVFYGGRDRKLVLKEKATPEDEEGSLLQPTWENGEFLQFQTFPEVRAVLASQA